VAIDRAWFRVRNSGRKLKLHAKTPECQSCEVMWIIDLRTLQDPSQPSDQPRRRTHVQHFGEVLLREERSVEQVEPPKHQSCEVTRVVDLGTLRDLPRPSDLGHGQPDTDHFGSKEEVTPRIPRTPKLRSNGGRRSRGYVDTP
jgi:hypothetical protein